MDLFLFIALALFLLSLFGRSAGGRRPEDQPADPDWGSEGRPPRRGGIPLPTPAGRPKMYFPKEQLEEMRRLRESVAGDGPGPASPPPLRPVTAIVTLNAPPAMDSDGNPLDLSREDLVRGIVLAELLGPPPGRRWRGPPRTRP